MDITRYVVSSRMESLLDGDYATYRSHLARKLLNCRKKLSIATKNRGKYHAKGPVSAHEMAENHEYLRLQLLTAERAWAHAMMMKASHSADTKAITGRTRSHMVSRLDKGARLAEKLARTLQDTASGATGTDALEARAYAAMLRGAALFELQRWEPCLGNYSIARIIYSALSTATKGDIFKDLLSETLDPSIRYAAYQLKIPRTEPVPTIAQKAFPHSDARLVELVTKLSATALGHDDADDKQAFPASAGAPTTLTWRNREVKIEDAAISAAWAAVGTAKARLAETLSSPSLEPKDRAAAYDDILNASQDAVDSTKQAIDELKAEGVPQSDSRMQSLQITRTAVHFDMISWRIGRNRVLTGAGDGAAVTFGAPGERAKKTKARLLPPVPKEEAPGRLLAKLREKAVLYDGTLQSIESITELPGVANDQELSRRLEATTGYFTALKCLAIARSHGIAGKVVHSLALVKHGLEGCEDALPVLTTADDGFPPNLTVLGSHVQSLHVLLSHELQRYRAMVDMGKLCTPPNGVEPPDSARYLMDGLAEYPADGADLGQMVPFPPKIEPVPVKPIFLDVAWNYIDYPGKQAKVEPEKAATIGTGEDGSKTQSRGWFGFGR